MGSTVFLNLIIGLVFKATNARARTHPSTASSGVYQASNAPARAGASVRLHLRLSGSLNVIRGQHCEAWAVPQDACEWFGADPSPSAEVIGTRIQNHFGAIVQIAIGGMFGLAQVRSVPECGPRLKTALRLRCVPAVGWPCVARAQQCAQRRSWGPRKLSDCGCVSSRCC